jgi:hypothetical protein
LFRNVGWLRGFVGDVLAVVFVYFCFKSTLRLPTFWLASAALFVGYTIELAQFIASIVGWKINNTLLRIVLGSTPDWWDIVAYTIGFLLIVLLEWLNNELSYTSVG